MSSRRKLSGTGWAELKQGKVLPGLLLSLRHAAYCAHSLSIQGQATTLPAWASKDQDSCWPFTSFRPSVSATSSLQKENLFIIAAIGLDNKLKEIHCPAEKNKKKKAFPRPPAQRPLCFHM